MVLSYTTLAGLPHRRGRHREVQGAPFSEGHYLQVEVAGMTTVGAENPLAKQFLAFMTGPKFQDVIPRDQLDVPGGQDRQAAERGLARLW